MKRTMIFILSVLFVMGSALPSYASDWDKAGKALTIIEGLRLITGGRVDVIGSMTGLNSRGRERVVYKKERPRPQFVYHNRYCEQRVWVPHYVWESRYVPEQVEYRRDGTRVITAGHYVRYQVERGGHWETRHEFCG